MLFLAITGLLFLIGFFGTGNQVRSVRFTDSARGLQSYLQKQYGLVSTGSNPRDVGATCSAAGALGTPPTFAAGTTVPGDTAGDAGDCVLLGRLVKFNPESSTVTSFYVAGRRLATSQLTGDDMADLVASGATLSPQAGESFTINWGLVFHQPSSAGSGEQSQAFAFLRSPNNGRIISFAFSNNAVSNATAPGNDASFRSAITSANLAKNAGYCLKDNNGRNAIIKLGYDQRADAIDVAFKGINQQTDCVRSKP